MKQKENEKNMISFKEYKTLVPAEQSKKASSANNTIATSKHQHHGQPPIQGPKEKQAKVQCQGPMPKVDDKENFLTNAFAFTLIYLDTIFNDNNNVTLLTNPSSLLEAH